MSFLKLSRVFLVLSALLVVGSLVLMVSPGPRLSIEFTGGTLMELSLPEGKTREDLTAALQAFQHGGKPMTDVSVARTRTDTYFARTPTLTNEEHQELMKQITQKLGKVTELQYTTIGPTVGQSLKQRAVLALLAACVAIILYLAFSFRKLPAGLSPWSFGSAAIVALVHDTLITVGIFTILSYYTTFQMDTLFISALLSVMGYSVSDTIVIFDRVRDNMYAEGQRANFSELVERSLRQSITRTLNTGLGGLIMLFALFFFGSESIRWFILALILGTIIGTYSSYFVATPLVILWRNWKVRK